MKSFVVCFAVLAAALAGCMEEEGATAPGVPQDPLPSAYTRAPDPTEPALECDASKAVAWTKRLRDEATAFQASISGRTDHMMTSMVLEIDAAQDYVYIRDQTSGYSLLAKGDDIYETFEGETLHLRQVGILFVDEFLGDDDDDGELFNTPIAIMKQSCVRGNPTLSHSGHRTETWTFKPDGTLVMATFEDPSLGHDVTMHITQSVDVRSPPAGAPKASYISYEVLSEGWAGGYYEQTIRISEDTYYNFYSDIRFDLFAGEEYVSSLEPAGVQSNDNGYLTLQDRGEPGLLDTGDTITISLGNGVDVWYLYDSWSDSYALEDVVAFDGTPTGTAPNYESSDPTDMIGKYWEWAFRGEDYYFELDIPLDILAYYDEVSFTYRNGEHDYASYVTNTLDDAVVQSIADELSRLGTVEGYNEDETLSMALAFVQSLEYTSDSVTTGFDEYPRFPLETLAADGGDCEDTSILFASIAQAMGYDTVMVSPPGHMAVGVAAEADAPGGGYTYNGVKYLYAETTGDGFEFGEIPVEYQGLAADIYELYGASVFIDSVVIGQGSVQPVTVTFANDGLRDAAGGEVTAFMVDGDLRVYDSDFCTFDALVAGMTYTCDLSVRYHPSATSVVVQLKTDDGYFAEY